MTQLTLEAVAQRLEALERKVAEFAPADGDPPGTTGDEQSDDPEAIARWIATFAALPPVVLTPEEEAAWQAARAEQKRIDAAARDRFIAGLPGAGG